VRSVQEDREQSIQSLHQHFGGVIVLKGAGTLICTEKQPVQRCAAGNPGMASGGMGDLLTGMIAGLVAQGMDLWQAAQAGVVFHAEAGDRVAKRQGERGMLACDLFAELPGLVNGK
jgi:NAD(P)H-hydrate epimerase